MIICHCNVLTRDEIEKAIRELLSDDPWVQLTPVRVYYALKKRGQCCGCFPAVANMIVKVANEARDMQQARDVQEVLEGNRKDGLLI